MAEHGAGMGPGNDADQESAMRSPRKLEACQPRVLSPRRDGSYIIPLLRSWRKDASGMADIGG